MLLIFPVILLVTGLSFALQIFPIYAGAYSYDQDPAYVYLFNGLSILDGHSPSHIDHPGTPLQVLVALVVIIQWVFLRLVGSENKDVISAVLSQPELYIAAVSLVLLILNACAIYYLGRRILKSIDDVKLALFCQSAPLVFWIVSPRIVYLSPEALLMFASVILLGLLAPVILVKNKEYRDIPGKTSMLAGIICGFGVAVKITFVPMLGLLLLLGNSNRVFRALRYMIITWAICLLPILGNVDRMVDRIYSFAIHSEKYGAGKADIINFREIPDRMLHLIEIYPLFYIVILVFLAMPIMNVVYVGVFKREGASSLPNRYSYMGNLAGFIMPITKYNMKIPLVLVFVGLFQTLLVLKHPGPHYMLPALPIIMLGVVWLAQSVESKWGHGAILLGLISALVVNSTVTIFYRLHDDRLLISQSLASVQTELAKYTNPLVIGTYRCILPECGLSFGVSLAPQLRENTAPFLLNFYTYNIWSKKIMVHSEGWVALDRVSQEIDEGRDVFLVSPKYYNSLNKFSLDIVVNTQIQSLYRVTGVLGGEL